MPSAKSAATATQYVGASAGRAGAVSKLWIPKRARRDCRCRQQQDRGWWHSSLSFHQAALTALRQNARLQGGCADSQRLVIAEAMVAMARYQVQRTKPTSSPS